MTLTIFKYPHNILRQKAQPVRKQALGEDLDTYMSEMAETMYSCNGIGLAAPQVGDLRRLIVMDLGLVGKKPHTADGAIWTGSMYGEEIIKMVNPVIQSTSESTMSIVERCLSFPDFSARVARPNMISIAYFTPTGERKIQTFIGYEAIIVQHELEHLDGVTIIDHSSAFKRNRYKQMIKERSSVKYIT